MTADGGGGGSRRLLVATMLSQVKVGDQQGSPVNVFTVNDGCPQCSGDGLDFRQALGRDAGR